jgi:hypothetical protein
MNKNKVLVSMAVLFLLAQGVDARQYVCERSGFFVTKKKCPVDSVLTTDKINDMASRVADGTVKVLSCTQEDATGKWEGYLAGVRSNITAKCLFEIDPSGSLIGQHCQGVGGSGSFTNRVIGGNINLNSYCQLSGRIAFDDGSQAELDSRMTKDHTQVIGIYKNNVGDRGSFNAIRLPDQ